MALYNPYVKLVGKKVAIYTIGRDAPFMGVLKQVTGGVIIVGKKDALPRHIIERANLIGVTRVD